MTRHKNSLSEIVVAAICLAICLVCISYANDEHGEHDARLARTQVMYE